jgi:hypothetical protein
VLRVVRRKFERTRRRNPLIDTHDDVVLQLPAELAYQLMECDVVWPYLRNDRVDDELVPAVVLTADVVASTVVATELNEDTINHITAAVRGWLNEHSPVEHPTLQSNITGALLIVDDTTMDSVIAELLRRAQRVQNG